MGALPGEVPALLERVNAGEREALSRVAPLVYQDLRRLSAHQMHGERPGHTFQPTALVQKAWLRLLDQDRAARQNRGQLLVVACHMMRRILVDHARRRLVGKRELPVIIERLAPARIDEILVVDEAFGRLEQFEPRQAQLFEMRFGSLSGGRGGGRRRSVARDCLARLHAGEGMAPR